MMMTNDNNDDDVNADGGKDGSNKMIIRTTITMIKMILLPLLPS